MATSRRSLLVMLAAATGATATSRATGQDFPGVPHRYPLAVPGDPPVFPRDFGAHPDFRTEWWYVTGWLDQERGRQGSEQSGFQVTFFRVRTPHPDANPSRFAPKELLFAHAALMRPQNGLALHAQRAIRRGSPGAACSELDTAVKIGDWQLIRQENDRYRTIIRDEAFHLDLVLTPPGRPADARRSPWLQGDHGFSRKGPEPGQASHYYSRPQLEVVGSVDGLRTTGIAWLDHEWSTTILDPTAAGWDWTGINLNDGSALVAFRIRRRAPSGDGTTGPDPAGGPIWQYCALRHADGSTEEPAFIRFEVRRTWRSPRTLANYPVSMTLHLPGRDLRLEPLFDDQELDSRSSTGTIYWEGAVRALDVGGLEVGRGYLELTGYDKPMRL